MTMYAVRSTARLSWFTYCVRTGRMTFVGSTRDNINLRTRTRGSEERPCYALLCVPATAAATAAAAAAATAAAALLQSECVADCIALVCVFVFYLVYYYCCV